MQEREHPELLIIRRGGHTEFEEHHGGVWKIAYADFMTAMMAFFLVMWLINVTDQETKESVARYFNPIRFAEATVERKGIRDPDPRPLVEGEKDSSGTIVPAAPQGPARAGQSGASAPAGRTGQSEAALFQDPYAVLARIAERAPAEPPPGVPLVDAVTVDGPAVGVTGDQARDPFDPVYWQNGAKPASVRGGEGRGTPQAQDAAAPVTAPRREAAAAGEERDGSGPKPDPKAAEAKPSEAKPADAKGAGAKPVEVKAADAKAVEAKVADAKAAEAKAEVAAAERRAAELREGIAAAVGRVPAAGAPELRVEASGDGVLVSLTDVPTFGMFAIGSAEPRPEVVRIVEKVAEVIRKKPGIIIVRGHTDGRPFRSREYDNWRLSSARAHMAAYMLMRGGIPENRIERVEGWADRSLKVTADPGAAANRRIEIFIREARS